MLKVKLRSVSKSVALVVIGGSLTVGTAIAGDVGTAVDVTAKYLFVPRGFDSNDQTEVVLDGFLPNACYRVLPAVVQFDATQNVYQVTPRAFHFEGDGVVCGTYQVPYTVSVKLGVVPPGNYTVVAAGTEKRELTVTRSTTLGPDDYLYAPVDQVVVDVDISRRRVVASITGRYTNSCMRWQENKILDQGDTVVVLPIIRMEERDDCHETDIAYKGIEVKLPWRGPGRYLLHTRSLSGVAVNRMFSIDGE